MTGEESSAMDDIKMLSATVALNHMMQSSFFSISTIDRVAEMLGLPVRGTDSYKTLATLHCIEWGQMPPQLRDAVPTLIRDCLGIEPPHQFGPLKAVATAAPAPATTATDVVDAKVKPYTGGLLRLIGVGGRK